MRNGPSVLTGSPMCSRLRKFAFSTGYRPMLAVLLALAYLVTAVGLRIPGAVASRQVTPFPCQGHQCGCRSAEQCWSHCCCFTASQRLAWAVEHQISPPVELTEALAAESHDDHPQLDGDHHSPKSCCHKSPAACTAVASHGTQGKKVLPHGFQPDRCHGINTQWVVSGAVTPPADRPAWSFDWTIVGVVPTFGCSLSAVPLLPAVPPPRV
jgi:hypothetical protein